MRITTIIAGSLAIAASITYVIISINVIIAVIIIMLVVCSHCQWQKHCNHRSTSI